MFSKTSGICFWLIGISFVMVLVSSCRNDDDNGPDILEPITFIDPDTTTISAAPGESVNLNVQLTTDRIIDTLRITYHIDSLMNGFDALTDPTFLYKKVGWADSSNIQTYIDVYQVPAGLESFDVVRLFFALEAKERFYQKTLKINVK